jgi:hypothetical protein
MKFWPPQYFQIVLEIFPGSFGNVSCIENAFGTVYMRNFHAAKFLKISCHNNEISGKFPVAKFRQQFYFWANCFVGDNYSSSTATKGNEQPIVFIQYIRGYVVMNQCGPFMFLVSEHQPEATLLNHGRSVWKTVVLYLPVCRIKVEGKLGSCLHIL